ncbi:TldD/PmbA family protein [Methanobrevibacter sp. DSM 116169]|uniref:TldD/PmbA family protein n=1 Tax=Methanobrevibacter sp. DSM 116169 TaxID=3242727 RepID=UPI0038FC713F
MLYEISDKAKKEVLKHCDNYEIYVEKAENFELDSQKTDLNFAKEEDNFGVGIRILNDDKIGFAFTSNIEQIPHTAKQAFLNSKLNEKDENFGFSNIEKEKEVKKLYDNKNKDLAIEDCVDFLKSMLNIAEEEKCEVTSGNFSKTSKKSLIINSNDISIYDKGTWFSTSIAVNARKGEELSSAYDYESSRFFDLNGETLTKNVCDIARKSIGGENIETKKREVVFDYHAAAGLLSTFISAFSADNVQRGRSILKDKIDKKIIDNNVSITNDSTLEKGLLSCKCDGEGTISKKTALVEDGILKSYIYDNYSSNKEGVESTSNGYRGSYSSIPQISPSNITFNFKKEESLDEIKDGFIATDVLGAHTANPISGDFSVEANNAFLIENGEITKSVKKAMISGNIFEILNDCRKLKSETKQFGPFIIPKIIINNLNVVG